MTNDIECVSCGEVFSNACEMESTYYCYNCGSTNPKFKADFVQVVIP